jgi:hypothetical protein
VCNRFPNSIGSGKGAAQIAWLIPKRCDKLLCFDKYFSSILIFRDCARHIRKLVLHPSLQVLRFVQKD